MTLSEWIQSAAALLTAGTLIANVAFAYFAFRQLKINAEALRQQRDASRANALVGRKMLLMQSNAMALTDEKTLAASIRIQFPEEAGEGKDPRDRFLAFNLLNCAEVAWLCTQLDQDSGKAAHQSYQHFLRRLLHQESTREILRTGGYSPEFIAHCEEVLPEFKQHMDKHRIS